MTLVLSLSSWACGAAIFVDNQLTTNCLNGAYSIANRDNSGGDGNAYMTIEAAATAAAAGDTVYIRAGTYLPTARITVSNKTGTSATARITFANYNGETVFIDGSRVALGTGYGLVDIQNSNYVVLQGLRFQNSSQVGVRYYTSRFGEIRNCSVQSTGGHGIHLQNAHNAIVEAVTVTGVVSAANSYNDSGIRLTDSNDVQITHSVIYHNTGFGIYLCGACRALVDKNELYDNYTGVMTTYYSSLGITANNNVISNNLVHDNVNTPENSDGIAVSSDSYYTIVSCNIVYGNADDGIDVSTGGATGISNLYATITGNIVFRNGDGPVGAGDGNGIKVSTNNGGGHTVAANVSFDNERGGFDQDKSPGFPQNFFYQNIAYNNPSGGFIMDAPSLPQNEDAVLYNNIAVNNGVNDLRKSNDLAVNDSDYNWWGDGLFVAGMDAHSLSGDPHFNNPGLVVDTTFGADWTIEQKLEYIRAQVREKFRLQAGSQAVDHGRIIAGYHCTTAGAHPDQSLREWYGTAPDMGAYEVALQAITDLAVSGVSQNSLTATWTAPSGSAYGSPMVYDLRYAGSAITEATWAAATPVSGEPVPDPGVPQSFTITGLTAGTSYCIGIKATDDAGNTSWLSNVVTAATATSGNHAPALDPIGDRSTYEAQTLTFTISATDADGDTLTYGTGALPANAGFNPTTRTFSWTPNSTQSGIYHVTFQVSDAQVVVSETIAITVREGANATPVLAAIGNKSINEGQLLSFTASATDSDVPADTLTFSLLNAPAGASINATTGTFGWTPTEAEGPGSYNLTVRVTDNGTPNLYDEEAITITVNEINTAPVLVAVGNKSISVGQPLIFTAAATDSDLPANTLTFSLLNAPTGASINATTGVFNWTPSYDQAGSYPVTVTVSDGELMDSEQITITVADVSDRTAPSGQAVYPAADAIQVPLNPLIVLTISDAGSGIEASTVTILVDNQVVYSGGGSLYESAYGTCRRTGTRASYHYYYQPINPFDFDQQVTVLANASDAVNNAMTPLSYQFTTQMRSFGQNQPVSSESDTSGHATVVTDSQGNLWAVWHAGAANARDIYVAKRGSQLQSWNTSLPLTGVASDRCNPALAIGPDDALYLAWQDNRRGNWDIYVSVSSDGTAWGDPIRVTDANDTQANPVIAVDQASPYHVYVAWERGVAGSRDIYLASCDSSFVSKTITRVTSDPADQAEPALAVDSDDTVYLFWTDRRNGPADIYGSSSVASSWSNTAVVIGSGNQSHPAVAAAPGTSTLHVVWQSDAAGNLDILYGTSDGLPSSPLTGSSLIDDTTGADQSAPSIVAARDHAGSVHVYACWQDNRVAGSTHDSDLYLAEIRAGTGGTNILVGDDGTNSNQSDPALGFDEYGQPIVVWTDSRGRTPRIYSAGSMYFKPVAMASALITRAEGGPVGTIPAAINDTGDVSIQIPPSACDCDVAVSISDIQNLPKFTAIGLTGYEISPSGIQFAFPATVTIPYTSSGPGRATPYWYDPQTGTLSQQGITEITNQTLGNGIPLVSFKTNHLTTFVLLENPLPNGGGSGGGGGCSMSSSQEEGSIVGFLLPYATLVPFLYLWKRRDRKLRETSQSISSP